MLTDIFQQGATAAWLYLPTAVLLGALHGLEPGHSKTMMNAAIIVFEWPGSSPCNAPSRTAVGRYNHAAVAPCWKMSVSMSQCFRQRYFAISLNSSIG